VTVEAMLARGELERVEPDEQAALATLAEARLHVRSAALIAGSDPNGGYQLAYDGARKAVAAHLRREGLRVRKGEGGHALTAAYASHVLGDELGRRLEAMRRRRNRSEYGSAYFGPDEVAEAVQTADALIEAVTAA
jgi:HEPN domain